MNLKSTKLFAVFAFMVGVVGLFGRADSMESTQLDEKVLVVGMSADYPPFEYKKNGQIVGFDVDLAQEIAQQLGYTLKIQDMDFSVLIPSLQSGRIDFAMSGMTVTDVRKKNVDFSDVYFSNTFAVVLRKSTEFSHEEDFKGKRVGVQLGTTMEKYGKEKAQSYPGMEVVPLGKNSFLIQELKAERLFGVITEQAQAVEFVKANPGLKFVPLEKTPDGYAVAFRKSSNPERIPNLREKVNSILDQLQVNGRTEQLRIKWLGQ